MNQQIFREYDIRGIAETDLNEECVAQVAKAIGTFFIQRGCRLITLGRDCRLSSTRIAEAVEKYLCDCGLEVWNLGFVPTPLSYFSVNSLNVDGGVMITASHNPPEYNGIKISLGKLTIHGDDIQLIKQIVIYSKYTVGAATDNGRPKRRNLNLKEAYIAKVLETIRHPLALKVVIDSGNGMAGMIAPELFRRLGCEVVELFSELDGRFPNHLADPSDSQNMHDLIKAVKSNNALVGVAFDGDADRIGVVDRTGRLIYGDELLVIYARDLLEKFPGAKIISEVKSSSRLFDDISAHGGKPIIYKTGHSLIKAKMKEVGALLAGEMSGHIFFADRYYGYDDALYAAARLFEILADTKKTPAELISDLPASFTTPEIRVECADEEKFEIVERVTREFIKSGLHVNTIDGARVEFTDGWGLVRASNTQPALVYRFEALSPDRLKEIRTLFVATVQKNIKPGSPSHAELSI